MSETNPIPKISNLSDLKQYLNKLLNSPPLNYYTPKIAAFWSRYGFKVKLAIVTIFILLILFFGIRLGQGLSRSTTNKDITPNAIPSLSVPTPTIVESKFLDLRQEIQAFSTLFPDPAPPTVDEQISVKATFKR